MLHPWQPVDHRSCHRQSDPFPLGRPDRPPPRPLCPDVRPGRKAARSPSADSVPSRGPTNSTGSPSPQPTAAGRRHPGQVSHVTRSLTNPTPPRPPAGRLARARTMSDPFEQGPDPSPTASGGRPLRYRTRHRRRPSTEPMALRTGEPSEAPGVDDLLGQVPHLHVAVLAVLAEDSESLVLGDPQPAH